MLKNMGNKALMLLSAMFRASYLMGYQPKEWRKARVIFIPKSNKKDYAMARSFRPITLSSFITKTMERVLLWHLQETTLQTSPLHHNQHAFRSQRSTENALSNMAQLIEGAVYKKQFALGVFLDIQGAFDNVRPDSIIRGLIAKHADTQFIDWYRYYLENRTVTVEILGVKKHRQVVKGTPQGGVLSPVIWNIVFDSFLTRFEEGWVKGLGFADDGGLVTTGSNPRVLASRMQRAINSALEWGRNNGLQFSASKTVAVLFTRKYKFSLPPPLRMGDQQINYSNSVKYLGVHFDQKLTWQLHFDLKVAAAKGRLLQIRQAMGRLWGTPPHMFRWNWTGMVRPAFSYGALVWAKASATAGPAWRL